MIIVAAAGLYSWLLTTSGIPHLVIATITDVRRRSPAVAMSGASGRVPRGHESKRKEAAFFRETGDVREQRSRARP